MLRGELKASGSRSSSGILRSKALTSLITNSNNAKESNRSGLENRGVSGMILSRFASTVLATRSSTESIRVSWAENGVGRSCIASRFNGLYSEWLIWTQSGDSARAKKSALSVNSSEHGRGLKPAASSSIRSGRFDHVGGNCKFPICGNRKPHTLVVGGGCPAFHDVDDVNNEGAGHRCMDGRRGCC